jgi:hypothetical protein
MQALIVGKPYHSGHRVWPEVVEYNYRCGRHELRMFLRGVKPNEVRAIESGPCEFALYVEPPLIHLCYAFDRVLPWSDAPYTWHRVAPDERQPVPASEETAPAPRARLHVVLVEAASGFVLALRCVSLAPDFTRALHRAIAEQARQAWDPTAYDAALTRLHATRTPAELAQLARVRCRGGE